VKLFVHGTGLPHCCYHVHEFNKCVFVKHSDIVRYFFLGFWFRFKFWVQVLGLVLGLGFQVTLHGPYANPSVWSLQLDKSNQSDSPNGKITSAVLLLLMAK